ncbi:GGDEF domain-containing response regulator [Gemmatimonas sp.]|uniref:GGDEF domain-containing response regulator n=1 Tax=Gemmatimonas sp. TaxID=1962908 RepID=UPI0022CACD8F|nr:GGDEF domain-containing response regulator [Gemmatimonas sp.]MCZ8203649.1 GGDEF domain-containing response regulator [Gemmatimonas sp.]
MTAPVPSPPGRLAGRARLRVLLVENDPVAARRSEASLAAHREFDVRVDCVPSLSGAIRLLLEQSYDAVVLELDVDDASGLATLAGIRGAAPTVPVVVYARALDDVLAVRALRAGAHECHDKQHLPPVHLARSLTFAIERQRRLAALEAARVDASHRATHDPLTGLANRALFLDQLERALAFGTRYHRNTGVLFIDLDGFKEVNDRHGHALGDRLLRVVADRLVQCVRRSDAVARLGGDEFVVLLPDVRSDRDLAHVKASIEASLQRPFGHEGSAVVPLAASIGCAMSPVDGVSAPELLAMADADMYREKVQRADSSAAQV